MHERREVGQTHRPTPLCNWLRAVAIINAEPRYTEGEQISACTFFTRALPALTTTSNFKGVTL
jgi:hypothetical protein